MSINFARQGEDDDEDGTNNIIDLSSGAISGQINMENNTIINLGNHVNPGDALNLTIGDSRYIKDNGTSLSTADISLNNHKLTNLANPTINTEVATKNYLDTTTLNQTTGDSRYLKLDGSSLQTASISMNNNYLFNLHDPNIHQDAVNLRYLQSNTLNQTSGDSRYLKLDGSSLPTAPISMNTQYLFNLHDPNSAEDAATKHNVDTTTLNQTTGDSRYLKLDGTSLPTTTINFNSNRITGLLAPTTNTDGIP